MSAFQKWIRRTMPFVRHMAPFVQHVAFWALAAYFWALNSPLAWAAKKKKEVVPVDTGKGYSIPYLFVLCILGLGLMAVLRPSSRLDKQEERHKDEEE